MIRILRALFSFKSAAEHRGDALRAAGLDHLADRPYRPCKKHPDARALRAGDGCPECILDAYFLAPPDAVEGVLPGVTPASGVNANVIAAQGLYEQFTRRK